MFSNTSLRLTMKYNITFIFQIEKKAQLKYQRHWSPGVGKGTHKYMTGDFPDLLQTLQLKVKLV